MSFLNKNKGLTLFLFYALLFPLVCFFSFNALAKNKTNLLEQAKQAWQNNQLLHHAFKIEYNQTQLYPDDLGHIQALENEWDQHVRNNDPNKLNRQTKIKQIAKICPHRAWSLVKGTPKQYLSKLSDNELDILYYAVLLSNIIDKKGYRHDDLALAHHLFKYKKYNCVTISLVSLHLFKRQGITQYRALPLPGHVTLQIHDLYLNNGKELLPPRFFNHSKILTGFEQRDNEEPYPPWFIVGSIYYNLGYDIDRTPFHKLAETYYRQVGEIYPKHSASMTNLGLKLFDKKQYQKALSYFKKAYEINSYYTSHITNLSQTYNNLNRHSEALAILLKAEKDELADYFLLNSIGNTYTQLTNFNKALEYYLQAEKLSPKDINIQYNLGITYLDLNKTNQAISHFKNVLAINPNDNEAKEHLNELLKESAQ